MGPAEADQVDQVGSAEAEQAADAELCPLLHQMSAEAAQLAGAELCPDQVGSAEADQAADAELCPLLHQMSAEAAQFAGGELCPDQVGSAEADQAADSELCPLLHQISEAAQFASVGHFVQQGPGAVPPDVQGPCASAMLVVLSSAAALAPCSGLVHMVVADDVPCAPPCHCAAGCSAVGPDSGAVGLGTEQVVADGTLVLV